MTHTETKNIYEYTIFRAILVLLVVLGHCSYLSIFSNYGNFDVIGESLIPLGQKLLYFPTYIIYSFHMPAFIFLSGTMFELHKAKYIQERKIFFYKKAKRLLIPFFLITSLYIVPIKYIVGYWNNSSNVLQDIFLGQFLIQGNNSLWFLEVLFIIFCLCLPFLFYNVEKKFYLIIFISSILISIFSGIVHIQLISLTLKYFCFFVFGIIFEQNREKFNSWLINKKILFLLIIIYSCFLGIKFLSKNSSIPYINSVISTFVAFAGILVLWGGYSCIVIQIVHAFQKKFRTSAWESIYTQIRLTI